MKHSNGVQEGNRPKPRSFGTPPDCGKPGKSTQASDFTKISKRSSDDHLSEEAQKIQAGSGHDDLSGKDTAQVKEDKIVQESSRIFYRFWKARRTYHLLSDIILIYVSFLIAYYLRFQLGFLDFLAPTDHLPPPMAPYYKVAGLTSLAWVYLLAKEQSYRRDLHFSSSLVNQILVVFKTGISAFALLIVLSFMVREFLLSRGVYLYAFVIASGSMIAVRLFFQSLDHYFDRRMCLFNRILLLGYYGNAKKLFDFLNNQTPCTGVIGRLCWDEGQANGGNLFPEVPVLGAASRIEEVWEKTPFNQLVVINYGAENCSGDDLRTLGLITALNFCEEKSIGVYMIPDLMDVIVSKEEVGSLAGIPLIRLRDSRRVPFYAILKRTLDVMISSLVLVLGLPLWLAVVVGIKGTSRGPVLYAQKRAGLHGQPFTMYKFRSMVHNAEQELDDLVNFDELAEPVFKIREDPRVTTFGKFLRRTSLDEIPQFFNVLMGTMSVVGPRPEQVELVERYNPFQRRRLKAKPGITGYQQVVSRADPSLSKRIEYDLWYLKNKSLLLDLYIILRTVTVILRANGT